MTIALENITDVNPINEGGHNITSRVTITTMDITTATHILADVCSADSSHLNFSLVMATTMKS